MAASVLSLCVGISWFLTHPLVGIKATTLKTNTSIFQNSECFLFHSKEAGPGRGRDRDVPRILEEEHARARQKPIALPSLLGLPHFCVLLAGSPRGELEH